LFRLISNALVAVLLAYSNVDHVYCH